MFQATEGISDEKPKVDSGKQQAALNLPDPGASAMSMELAEQAAQAAQRREERLNATSEPPLPDAGNVKATYRGAEACLALQEFDKALEWTERLPKEADGTSSRDAELL